MIAIVWWAGFGLSTWLAWQSSTVTITALRLRSLKTRLIKRLQVEKQLVTSGKRVLWASSSSRSLALSPNYPRLHPLHTRQALLRWSSFSCSKSKKQQRWWSDSHSEISCLRARLRRTLSTLTLIMSRQTARYPHLSIVWKKRRMQSRCPRQVRSTCSRTLLTSMAKRLMRAPTWTDKWDSLTTNSSSSTTNIRPPLIHHSLVALLETISCHLKAQMTARLSLSKSSTMRKVAAEISLSSTSSRKAA